MDNANSAMKKIYGPGIVSQDFGGETKVEPLDIFISKSMPLKQFRELLKEQNFRAEQYYKFLMGEPYEIYVRTRRKSHPEQLYQTRMRITQKTEHE